MGYFQAKYQKKKYGYYIKIIIKEKPCLNRVLDMLIYIGSNFS